MNTLHILFLEVCLVCNAFIWHIVSFVLFILGLISPGLRDTVSPWQTRLHFQRACLQSCKLSWWQYFSSCLGEKLDCFIKDFAGTTVNRFYWGSAAGYYILFVLLQSFWWQNITAGFMKVSFQPGFFWIASLPEKYSLKSRSFWNSDSCYWSTFVISWNKPIDG